MVTCNQREDGWTLVLRRQPTRVVDGRLEGSHSHDFELICCECGDDPDRDYCEVAPGLQRVRGPYTIRAGLAAYEAHLTCTTLAGTASRPGRYPMLAEWR